ncbi:phosphopantetheine-binding protein [Streptomyces sp. NPDC059816]|uniref:phosphopantetheine-binding protein n=1 Tax=Streptomyces sp. NPDC059816 TaxID=3346960 RepID=UPI003668F296
MTARPQTPPHTTAHPTPPSTAPHITHHHTVHAIWAHTLDIDTIGFHDNFFALSGHSLTAAQAAARLSQTFKINCPYAASSKTRPSTNSPHAWRFWSPQM